jgi:hypothetical protein
MSPIDIGLHALALPFAVALVTIAILRPLLRLTRIDGAERAAVALGIGAGYLAGHIAIAWPSGDVTDRIPIVALTAILLGLFESLWPAPGWARWENRLLLAALVVGAVLGPLIETMTATRDGYVRLGAIALAIAVARANLEALARRLPPAAFGLAIGFTTVGVAITLLLAGNMLLCQLVLALGASLGAAWLLSLWWPRLSLSRGGVAVVAVVLGSLLICGQFYSVLLDSTALTFGWVAVGLVAAPLAAWVGMIGPIRRRPIWVVSLVVGFATLIPVAIAVGVAIGSAPEPPSY